MSTKVQDYLERAEHCERMATLAIEYETRARFAELARQWRALDASIKTLKILRHNQGSPPPKPSVLPSNTFSAPWPPSFLWERDGSLCCHDLSICNALESSLRPLEPRNLFEGAALDHIVVVTGSTSNKGGHFPARMGSSNRLGGHLENVFIRAKFQAQGQTGSF